MRRSKAMGAATVVGLLVQVVYFGGARAAAEETSRPNRVYWGDTHVHSSYSLDANMFGNTKLTPEHAYRFAKGETVDVGRGMHNLANRGSRPARLVWAATAQSPQDPPPTGDLWIGY